MRLAAEVSMKMLGVGAVLVCVITSAMMNWEYWRGQSQGGLRAEVFGAASLGLDILKVVIGYRVWVLLQERRYVAGVCALLLATLLSAFALTSALSFVAETKDQRGGERASAHAALRESEREFQRLEAKRDGVMSVRSMLEIEREIEAVLNVFPHSGNRRRTIGVATENCTKPERQMADVCSRVGVLRVELARAAERKALDDQLGVLRERIVRLRDRGAAGEANPEATVMARVTRGWLSVSEVVVAQSLMFPVLLELCATFGLGLLIDSRRKPRGRDDEPARDPISNMTRQGEVQGGEAAAIVYDDRAIGSVGMFMVACMQPRQGSDVAASELFSRYCAWSESKSYRAMTGDEFATQMKMEVERRGLKWKRREGQAFVGGVEWR